MTDNFDMDPGQLADNEQRMHAYMAAEQIDDNDFRDYMYSEYANDTESRFYMSPEQWDDDKSDAYTYERVGNDDESHDHRVRDDIDFINDAVVGITDDAIEERLHEALDRAGYGRAQDAGASTDLTEISAATRARSTLGDVAARSFVDSDQMQTIEAARKLLRQVQDEIRVARHQAALIITEAREEADKALNEAAQIVRNAKEQAEQIISDAQLLAALEGNHGPTFYVDGQLAAKKALGARMREIRKDAGLTARALAAATGQHYTRVSKIENGTQIPTDGDIRAWCEACHAEEQAPDLTATVGSAFDGDHSWTIRVDGQLAAKKALGARMREIRRDAGLTARALAAVTSQHYTRLSKIENGAQIPTDRDIRAWCEACHAEEQTPDLTAMARAICGITAETSYRVVAV